MESWRRRWQTDRQAGSEACCLTCLPLLLLSGRHLEKRKRLGEAGAGRQTDLLPCLPPLSVYALLCNIYSLSGKQIKSMEVGRDRKDRAGGGRAGGTGQQALCYAIWEGGGGWEALSHSEKLLWPSLLLYMYILKKEDFHAAYV